MIATLSLLLFPFYFVPSVVSMLRGQKNWGSILVLNIFLGWTFIGWVVALVWACAAIDDIEAAAKVAKGWRTAFLALGIGFSILVVIGLCIPKREPERTVSDKVFVTAVEAAPIATPAIPVPTATVPAATPAPVTVWTAEETKAYFGTSDASPSPTPTPTARHRKHRDT
jgi:hypothetical protein